MKKLLCLILVVFTVMLAAVVACKQPESSDGYQNYKEIPEITQDEIDAIEDLLLTKPQLVYGICLSTESFLHDQEYGGFSKLFTDRMSQLFGFDFVLTPVDRGQLISGIDDHSIDFTGELTLTPQRAIDYFMTDPIVQRPIKVFIDSRGKTLEGIAKERPIKIAFVNNSVIYNLIEKSWSLPYEAVFVQDETTIPDMIYRGEVDAFIDEGIFEADFIDFDYVRTENFYPLSYSPVSLTTANPQLAAVISVMQKYLEHGGSYELAGLYNQGYKDYLRHELYHNLSDDERVFIDSHNTAETAVLVACESDNYPLSFYNAKEKEFQGIVPDILAQLSDITGIQFRVGNKSGESWGDLLEGLESGKYSMISELLRTASRKDKFLWADKAYHTEKYALISRADLDPVDINQIRFSKVGLVRDSAYSDIFNEWFNQNNSIEYDTVDQCIAALENGSIDLIMFSQNLALHLTNYLEKPGYKINVVFDYSSESYFGYNIDQGELCNVMNKAQRYIDLESINQSWKHKVFDYQAKMLKEIMPWLIGLGILLLAALLVATFMLIKNRRMNKNLDKTVKQRTKQLEIQEETLKRTLDNLDACIYVTDIDTGEILFINQKMKKEYNDVDCLGKKCYKVLQTGYEERCDFCPVPKLLEGGQEHIVWEEHSTVTGKYYRNTDNLIKWHDGKLAHMQHSVDITAIKEAQSALSKRLRQQSLMTHISQSFLSDTDIGELIDNALRMSGEFMEIAQILFYKMDESGKFFTCSNGWVAGQEGIQARLGEKMGISGELAQSFMQTMLKNHSFYLSSNDEKIRKFMQPYRVNYKKYILTPVFLKDKLHGVLDFSAIDDGQNWRDSDSDLAVLISSLLSGFFERHLMESELITAKELAEQGSRSKSDFLSRMSHEIRTPLNAVIGMNNIAMSTTDPARMQYCHEKIDTASKHLLGVINDVLDMSKIEAEKFELSVAEFDFEKMLVNVTNVLNFKVEEKKQNFVVELVKNVPDFIFGDELRLAQVITNLLSNAVKFTPEQGSIKLRVSTLEDNDDTVTLQVDVSDTGIGISREQQSKLFTSFEQADGSISRKFGGTGLGLAISKRMVELMGGKMWIESDLGKGSTFSFTISAKKGKDRAATRLMPQIDKKNISILAVDDSLDVRTCFANVLAAHGLPCDTAASGKQALEMIEKRLDKPYNVFFVDWQMPEMDGIMLTKRIKQLTGDNSVVFMISVADWNTIEKEAFAAGVKSFVPKPLFPSHLINAINECFGVSTAKSELLALGSGSVPDLTGHTLLVAEDVDINQEIMSAILEDTNASVDFADNGVIALEMFGKNPQKYSLIFMDIHMPEMDGYESTRKIRAIDNKSAKTVPIIAMTANVFKEDIDNCMAAGMNGHLGKPVDANKLYEMLSNHLVKK